MLTNYLPATLNNWLEKLYEGDDFFFSPKLVSGNYPAVEIREENGGYVLNAELPGITKNDISLSVENGVLTISGEKKHEKKENKKGYHYSEISYGRFSRSFRLGEHINPEGVEASFKDGMLEVHLKKSEKSQAKQIEVK